MLASVSLAMCLIREHRYAESQKNLHRAEAIQNGILKNDVDLRLMLETAILKAEGQACLGDTAGALRNLRAVVAKTQLLGYRGVELKARLAAGVIELKSGQRTAGRQQLLAIANEASAQGFGLVASEASEAAK